MRNILAVLILLLTVCMASAQSFIGSVMATNDSGRLVTPTNFFRTNILAGTGIVFEFMSGGRVKIHGGTNFSSFTVTNLTVISNLTLGTNIIYSLAQGTNILFVTNGQVLTIHGTATGGSGEVNTSSNVGDGVGIAAPKVGVDLPFKSFKSASGAAAWATNATNITLTININTNAFQPASSNLTNWATISTNVLTGLSPPWTNDGSYTFLKLNTNAIHIDSNNGALTIGSNTLAAYGFAGSSGDILASWGNNSSNDFIRSMSLGVLDGSTTNMGTFDTSLSASNSTLTLSAQRLGTNRFWEILVDSTEPQTWKLRARTGANREYLSFDLGVTDTAGSVAYLFDTENALPSATNLVAFRTFGTNRFAIAGNAVFPNDDSYYFDGTGRWSLLNTNGGGTNFITSVQSNYFEVVGGQLNLTNANLTNWANLNTNVLNNYAETNWINEAGILHPISAGIIHGTNASFWEKLIAKSAFITEDRARTLVLGTNTVQVITNSFLLLDSPTNDPAQVVVELSAASSSGQWLLLLNNQTNKGFTIYDNSGTGTGIVDLQGDFVSTNKGRGLLLVHNGVTWNEIGRFDTGGSAPSVGGSGTPEFLPIWLTSTTLGDSPIQRQTNAPFNQVIDEPGIFANGVFKANSYLLATTIASLTSDGQGFILASDPSYYRLMLTNNSATNRWFTLGAAAYSNQPNDTVELLLEFMGGSSVTLSNSGRIFAITNWVANTLGDRIKFNWNNYNAKWEEQWRYPPLFTNVVAGSSGTVATIQTNSVNVGTETNINFLAGGEGITVVATNVSGTNTVQYNVDLGTLTTQIGVLTQDFTIQAPSSTHQRMMITNDAATNRYFTLFTPTAVQAYYLLVEHYGPNPITLAATNANVALTNDWTGQFLNLLWDPQTQKWQEQYRYPIYTVAGGGTVTFADLVFTNDGTNIRHVDVLNRYLSLNPTNTAVSGSGIIITGHVPSFTMVATNNPSARSLFRSTSAGQIEMVRFLDNAGVRISTNGWVQILGPDINQFPASTIYHFTVATNDFSGAGAVNQFGVTGHGNIGMIRGLQGYVWPAAHAVGALTNDGTGVLGYYDLSGIVSGSSLTTNGNQFLGVPLSIKDSALVTNLIDFNTLTVTGNIPVIDLAHNNATFRQIVNNTDWKLFNTVPNTSGEFRYGTNGQLYFLARTVNTNVAFQIVNDLNTNTLVSVNTNGNSFFLGNITNEALTASRLVMSTSGKALTSSAFTEGDINNLQGATNQINLRVIALEGITNHLKVTVQTNGVAVGFATNLNFLPGSGISIRGTNVSGTNTISIHSTGVAPSSLTVASNGVIFATGVTNLNFVNVTLLTNDNGDVSIDPVLGVGDILSQNGSTIFPTHYTNGNGRLTLGTNSTISSAFIHVEVADNETLGPSFIATLGGVEVFRIETNGQVQANGFSLDQNDIFSLSNVSGLTFTTNGSILGLSVNAGGSETNFTQGTDFIFNTKFSNVNSRVSVGTNAYMGTIRDYHLPTAGPGQQGIGDDASRTYLAVRFLATNQSYFAKDVAIWLFKNGSPTYTMKASIWNEDEDIEPLTQIGPESEVIYATNVSNVDITNYLAVGVNTYIQAGNYYWIVLRAIDAPNNGSDYIGWLHSSTSGGTSGSRATSGAWSISSLNRSFQMLSYPLAQLQVDNTLFPTNPFIALTRSNQQVGVIDANGSLRLFGEGTESLGVTSGAGDTAILSALPGLPSLTLSSDATNWTWLNPNSTAGTTPFVLGTGIGHIEGELFEVRHTLTRVFGVGLMGEIRSIRGMPTNAASFPSIVTNLQLNTYYTNLAQRGTVGASVWLAPSSTNSAEVALYLDQNGDGTWEQTQVAITAGAGVVSSNRFFIQGNLQPGARFILTNLTVGTAVATLPAGASQWTSW